MDALKRARAFVRAQECRDQMGCDQSDQSDESGEEGEVRSLISLWSQPDRTCAAWEVGAEGAAATLHSWLDQGALDALPEQLPGFTGDLAPYADRVRLIGLVRAILDAVPWSLTGQERAVQVVAILTPLIDGDGSGSSSP
jgi:hypothetical protein